jgi:hypothetical protein
MENSVSPASIEIRAETIPQLFDTLDPFPFPKKDLAETTENYIVDWARELPKAQTIEIVVYLPSAEAKSQAAQFLGAAFAGYFASRANRLGLDRRELFRIGRWSLLIGAAVLAVCMVLSQLLTATGQGGYVRQFFSEGLIILGWVANWRPMEIFLYEWWPLLRQQALYKRLAAATVDVRSNPGDG